MKAGLIGLAAVAAVEVAACGNPAPSPTAAPSSKPSSSPSATPAPTGPFAVVVTNAQRTGSTYQVLLIDDSGDIVQQVTAQLPHEKPNQTIDLPLVSASGTAVYYLDGDTDIHSLTSAGPGGLVKTIASGTTAELAFAVSPDSTRIAISAITEQSDDTKAVGVGYAEDLSDAGNHVQLWSNTGPDAARWPVAWSGGSIIDAVNELSGGGCYAGPPCDSYADSYHVISATSGQRLATVCEAPPSTGGIYYYYSVSGAPTGPGTVCEEETQSGATTTDTMETVSWTGAKAVFVTHTTTGNAGTALLLENCFLSPDGSRLLCESNTNQSAELVSPSGTITSLGRKYTLMGWIDATHFLVELDSTHLGVLEPDSGTVTPVSLPNADQTTMAGALPNAL